MGRPSATTCSHSRLLGCRTHTTLLLWPTSWITSNMLLKGQPRPPHDQAVQSFCVAFSQITSCLALDQLCWPRRWSKQNTQAAVLCLHLVLWSGAIGLDCFMSLSQHAGSLAKWLADCWRSATMCLSTLYMTLSTASHSLVAHPEGRGRKVMRVVMHT